MSTATKLRTTIASLEQDCAQLETNKDSSDPLVKKIAESVTQLSKAIHNIQSADLSLEEMKEVTQIVRQTTQQENKIQKIFESLITEKTPKETSSLENKPPVSASSPTKAILTKDENALTHFKGSLVWKGVKYFVEQDLPQTTTQTEWEEIVKAYEQILNESLSNTDAECQPGADRIELSFHAENKKMDILFSSKKTIAVEVKQEIADILQKHQSTSVIQNKNLGIYGKIISIPNKGNTCFIASTIQAWLIYQQKGLKKKLSNAKPEEKEVIEALLSFIEKYKKQETIDIRIFLETVMVHYKGGNAQLSQFAKEMIEWKKSASTSSYPALPQVDTEEFMRWLSSFIQPEEITRLHKEDLLLAEGETLQEPKTTNDPYEGRRDLIPLKGQTLSHLIDLSFQDDLEEDISIERLIRNKDQNLEEKKVPLKSRTEQLSQAPQEFILSLKRFDRNNERIGDPIRQVNEFLEMPEKHFADGKSAKYRLRSIICHKGTKTNSGHYVAYVRKINPQGLSQFYLADDGRISPEKTEDVLKAAETAYQIIYDKIN